MRKWFCSGYKSLITYQVLLDCGAVQADALTVDRLASLEKVIGEIFHFSFLVFFSSVICCLLPSFSPDSLRKENTLELPATSLTFWSVSTGSFSFSFQLCWWFLLCFFDILVSWDSCCASCFYFGNWSWVAQLDQGWLSGKCFSSM